MHSLELSRVKVCESTCEIYTLRTNKLVCVIPTTNEIEANTFAFGLEESVYNFSLESAVLIAELEAMMHEEEQVV